MRASLGLLLTALIGASCSSLQEATTRIPADSLTVQTVTEGVIHRHIVRGSGPWNIHILSIDLSREELDVVSARAFDSLQGRETTSSIARRHSTGKKEVIAAINADFFNMKTGEGDMNQLIDGEIVKGVKKPSRAQFGLDFARTPYIEHFLFAGTAVTSNKQIQLDAVNTVFDSSIVFLNRFFKSYEVVNGETVVALKLARVTAETLVTVADGTIHAGRVISINDSIYLLRAAHRTDLSSIGRGDTVRVSLGFIPLTEKLKTLVGGLPRLVRDGARVVEDSMPGIGRRFTETRHPRTGVGFSKDGKILYFATVDGRQRSSAGMSLTEFAGLMIEAGCYNALNLDGGGSTTMVIRGEVRNSPSDASGERPVANVLMVVKRIKSNE